MIENIYNYYKRSLPWLTINDIQPIEENFLYQSKNMTQYLDDNKFEILLPLSNIDSIKSTPPLIDINTNRSIYYHINDLIIEINFVYAGFEKTKFNNIMFGLNDLIYRTNTKYEEINSSGVIFPQSSKKVTQIPLTKGKLSPYQPFLPTPKDNYIITINNDNISNDLSILPFDYLDSSKKYSNYIQEHDVMFPYTSFYFHIKDITYVDFIMYIMSLNFQGESSNMIDLNLTINIQLSGYEIRS